MKRSSSSFPQIDHLRSVRRDAGGDFEHLLDYEGFRYHLLLRFNPLERDSLENVPLKKLYDAWSRNDQDAVDRAADECVEVFWPFIDADYASRSQSTEIPNGVIKLQAITINGVLQVVNHSLHLETQITKPVPNTFPGVLTFSSSDIEQLCELDFDIFKIRLRSSIYCMKTVHRTGHEANFIREVSILRECSHSNIIHLVGLVRAVDEDEKIEGMVIEYVENARSLRYVECISVVQCEKWGRQIRDAIEYLHRRGLIWGDVKPANVLINGNDDAVLIDFGGGRTEGWVDLENYETCRGDLQGWERIVSFMEEKAGSM